jgi:hypothetical protein
MKYPLDLRDQDLVMYERGWNDAIKAAAQAADDWDHHGDPGFAMYASPRIRDKIKRLTTHITTETTRAGQDDSRVRGGSNLDSRPSTHIKRSATD